MVKFLPVLKHILPWLAALAIFGYLFHLYPIAQVWKAAQYVQPLAFSLFALGYFLFIFLTDTAVTRWVIARFAKPIPFFDILGARGVTYLIMVLNYPASQAAFAYYLKRRYSIPIFHCLSMFLLIVVVDLLWVTTLGFAGSFVSTVQLGTVNLQPTIQIAALCIYVGFFLWLLFWRKKFRFPFLEEFRTHPSFSIFAQAKLSDYLSIAIMRIPIHFTLIISMYIVVQTFQTHIPFLEILAKLPVVFFIGTIPITPGGLGTTNAAMVELLAPSMVSSIFAEGKVTPAELMFTITILWVFANYVLKILSGMFFLKRISKNLFKPTPDVPLEKAEKAAPHLGGNI